MRWKLCIMSIIGITSLVLFVRCPAAQVCTTKDGAMVFTSQAAYKAVAGQDVEKQQPVINALFHAKELFFVDEGHQVLVVEEPSWTEGVKIKLLSIGVECWIWRNHLA